jgi:alpha-galactosidase
MRARSDGPFQAGWCSWYRFFERIDEDLVRKNLAYATDWPLRVFQVDDGYQRSIGDWLRTSDAFTVDTAGLADAIDRRGLTPGIWLAPFCAHPDPALGGVPHGEFARDAAREEPHVSMVNQRWGGVVNTLDVTRPEVEHRLETLGRELVDQGWRYLKLDFTYAVGMPGRFQDRGLTPAQRTRRAFAAVRRGADDAYVVACGAPMLPTVGLVDAMRIGADVTIPQFPRPIDAVAPGYARADPPVVDARRSVVGRASMHRRLWQNDPDCLLLRPRTGQLDAEATSAWARLVSESGGPVVLSEHLPELDAADAARFSDLLRDAAAADVLATERGRFDPLAAGAAMRS